MESIQQTTKRLIESWHSCDEVKKDIVNLLKKNITAQEKRHIKYYSLKKSRLILGMDSSVWLYTLSLKKAQLLKILNQSLGSKGIISAISLRLSPKI